MTYRGPWRARQVQTRHVVENPRSRNRHETRGFKVVMPIGREGVEHLLPVEVAHIVVRHVVPANSKAWIHCTVLTPSGTSPRGKCDYVRRCGSAGMFFPEVPAPIGPVEDVTVSVFAGKNKRLMLSQGLLAKPEPRAKLPFKVASAVCPIGLSLFTILSRQVRLEERSGDVSQ